jgi:hypothetical protein
VEKKRKKRGGGGGGSSALIACWHRGVQQEGKGELLKHSVTELKIKKILLRTGYTDGDSYTCISSTVLHHNIEL